MNKIKILITCPPMLKSLDLFRSQFESKNIELVTPDVVQILSEQELIKIVPEVDGWIIGDDPATEKVFAAGKQGRLKAAVKWGVGTDNVDLIACEKLNIPISNTPKMFGNEVADLAVGYLIGLARHSYFINEQVKKGNWIKPVGTSLNGKTIAVIGLGDIGQSVIRRLKGFEMNIIGYDPYCTINEKDLGVLGLYEFPNHIENADFVMITCSLNDSNFHLINKTTLNFMKQGVMIINVSRGALINEKDLVEGLNSGRVLGIALDVFEFEPLPINSDLRKFNRSIFGTHNGSNTQESVMRASNLAIQKLFNFLNV